MLTVIVILVFAGTIAFDFLPGMKQQPDEPEKNAALRGSLKDNVVYCAFVLASFVVLILHSFNIMVPGPSGPITDFVDMLFHIK